MNKNDFKGAIISDCGKFRWQLWRVWDFALPKVLWIMHNPSTADGEQDDPTIRKIIFYTQSWGYGGLYVGNLFPYRATNPKELKGKPLSEIWTPENIRHINEMKAKCKLWIFAYGNPVIPDAKPELLNGELSQWHYLKINEKTGNPAHPLYLKSDLKPIRFAD